MEASRFEWTRVDDLKRHGGRGSQGRKGCVWLNHPKTSQVPHKMMISSDLVKEAGLKAGDTLWLYKSGNMFMLKKEPSDFVLRHITNSASTLVLSSVDFIAHLNYPRNGYEFDAWYNGEGIILKPKEVNQFAN